jgi:hypothetical protein
VSSPRCRDPETALAATLKARAESAPGTLTDVTGIHRQAAQLRRVDRRRKTSWTVAAVTILAIPMSVVILTNASRGPGVVQAPDERLGRRTPAADREPSASSVPIQIADQAAFGDIPPGPPPRWGYVLDTVFYGADGTSVDLGGDEVTDVLSVASFREGFIAVVSGPSINVDYPFLVDRLDSRGDSVHRSLGEVPVAVNHQRDRVAYVTYDSTYPLDEAHALLTLAKSSRNGGEISQAIDGSVRPAGIIGDFVVYGRPWVGGAWITDLRRRPRRLTTLTSVNGVDEAHLLVAGVGRTGQGVVLDPFTERVVWARPDWFPTKFSPDGQQVLAFAPNPAPGDAYWAVLHAETGDVVRLLDPPPGIDLLEPQWEDNSTLLILSDHAGSRAILRLRVLEGGFSRVTKVVAPISQLAFVEAP